MTDAANGPVAAGLQTAAMRTQASACQRLKIAIVHHNMGNLWGRPDDQAKAGGAERQLLLQARELSQRHSVAVFTLVPEHSNYLSQTRPHNVHVVAVPRPLQMPKGLRVVVRAARLSRSTLDWGPDVVILRATSLENALIARSCRRSGVPVVYEWAHDDDLTGRCVYQSPLLAMLAATARRQAQVQICQTRKQLDSLDERQRRRSVIVPNSIDPTVPWLPASGSAILWIGRIFPGFKRPLRVFDIARAAPEHQFWIIGPLAGPEEFQTRFLELLENTANVDWLGSLDRKDLPAMLSRGKALLITSTNEGFPNVALEAVAASLPIIGVGIDPGGLIGETGCGVVVEDNEDSVIVALQALNDPKTLATFLQGAQKCQQRFEISHAIIGIESALCRAIAANPRG